MCRTLFSIVSHVSRGLCRTHVTDATASAVSPARWAFWASSCAWGCSCCCAHAAAHPSPFPFSPACPLPIYSLPLSIFPPHTHPPARRPATSEMRPCMTPSTPLLPYAPSSPPSPPLLFPLPPFLATAFAILNPCPRRPRTAQVLPVLPPAQHPGRVAGLVSARPRLFRSFLWRCPW